MDIRNAFPTPASPVKFADISKGDTIIHFAEGQAWVSMVRALGENTGEWWTNERTHYVFDKATGEWGSPAVSYSKEDDILAVAPWHASEAGHSLFRAV